MISMWKGWPTREPGGCAISWYVSLMPVCVVLLSLTVVEGGRSLLCGTAEAAVEDDDFPSEGGTELEFGLS